MQWKGIFYMYGTSLPGGLKGFIYQTSPVACGDRVIQAFHFGWFPHFRASIPPSSSSFPVSDTPFIFFLLSLFLLLFSSFFFPDWSFSASSHYPSAICHPIFPHTLFSSIPPFFICQSSVHFYYFSTIFFIAFFPRRLFRDDYSILKYIYSKGMNLYSKIYVPLFQKRNFHSKPN